MKQRFLKRISKLRNDCLITLSDGILETVSIVGDTFAYSGFYLHELCAYDAIVWVDNEWQLKQGEYLYSVYAVPVDTLCSYVDYIIETYKL
jgi:hypothetical protein